MCRYMAVHVAHGVMPYGQMGRAPLMESSYIANSQHARRPTLHAQPMTAVGFEPTPLRTGALSQRLRPLGQTVVMTS